MTHLICELHKKLFTMPWVALALIAAGLGALVCALIAQYFFHVLPCILCYYQRVPYGVVAFFGALALGLRRNDKAVRVLLALSALAFFINVGIAFFHSGVERHWWAGTDSCGVNEALLKDPQAAVKQLLAAPVVQCDVVDFTFLGFTMANWNVVVCFFLGLFASLAALGPCVNWGKPGACGCGGKKKE